MKKYNLSTTMRLLHRYVGYFMAGIMLIYAVSGVLLVFRDTTFLKKEKIRKEQLAPNLTDKALQEKRMTITKRENELWYFKNGVYNSLTGEAIITEKKLPWLLDKFTHLHKTESKDKYSWLNVVFGVCLFFFVLSSFFMFNFKSLIFKKAMWYTVAGVVLAVLLVLFT